MPAGVQRLWVTVYMNIRALNMLDRVLAVFLKVALVKPHYKYNIT